MTLERDNLAALRAEVRDWASRNVPLDWRARMTDVGTTEFIAFQRDWMQRLVEAEYATTHWPAPWPGGGRSLGEQLAIVEELVHAHAPRLVLHFVGLYHAAMTIAEWGTPQQKKRYLTGILQGETWCQGFSEPNAGSDLASLNTRAVRDGEHYVVNGQKIWSTLGQHADHCLLLVRTDSNGPKQAGVTYLLMDMKSEGVECRPIRQITGDAEFSQIFLTDVRVPVTNRLGDENAGWRVAQTTLSSERGMVLFELTERLFGARRSLLDAITDAQGVVRDDQVRREVVDVFIQIDAVRALVHSMMADQIAGKDVGGAASIAKLAYSRAVRAFTTLGLRIDPDAHVWQPYTLGAGNETGNWQFDYMGSFMISIAGGSNEIQRNIVSERVLGMPREKSS